MERLAFAACENINFAEPPLEKHILDPYHWFMYRSLPDRTHLPLWRVVAAFIFVPAIMALSVAIVVPLYSGLPSETERIWRSALAYGLIGAYPTTLMFGVPTYMALRKYFDPSLLNCI